MSDLTFRLLQGTQQRVPRGLLVLYSVLVVDGRLAVQIGMGGPCIRSGRVTVSVGSAASFDGVGRVEVLDARVARPERRAQALLRFVPAEQEVK